MSQHSSSSSAYDKDSDSSYNSDDEKSTIDEQDILVNHDFENDNDSNNSLYDDQDGQSNAKKKETEALQSSPKKEVPQFCLPVYAAKSVNLITSPSNSGKTTLLINILQHRERFFDKDMANSVLYINCNTQNKHTRTENPFLSKQDEANFPTVEVFNLSEIENVNTLVNPKQLIILDDVVYLNDTIMYFVTYAANHLDLIVFIVTQGCLATKLFELLYKIHTITLFFRNSSSTPLIGHLTSRFFVSPEKKRYLKSICSTAESNKTSVIIKLNTISSSSSTYKKIMAFSNLEQLMDESSPFIKIHPEIGESDNLSQLVSKFIGMKLPDTVTDDDFILVQAKHVKRTQEEGNLKQDSCIGKNAWSEMYNAVIQEIYNTFPQKRWTHAINIFKEILRVKHFCISKDYRTLLIKNAKKNRISIIDLITVATRRSHPNEPESKFKEYIPFIKNLLNNKIPLTFLKNQRLIEIAQNGRNGRGVKGNNKKETSPSHSRLQRKRAKSKRNDF